MVPPLDAATGLLPLGRHHVTLDAVKARYVDDPEFSGSATRQEIWADFEDATEVFGESFQPRMCGSPDRS